MSGILDSRQRIMDTIVTLVGRQQIADGKLKIEYFSFTDGATFYSLDEISGSSDPTNRLYFEQSHLPQDQITFEADDSGKIKFLNSFASSEISNDISGNSIYSINSSSFTSTIDNLLSSSIENYKNLYLIGTKDVLFLEEENTQLSKNEITFKAISNKPLQINAYKKSINNIPGIFNNKLFKNSSNFNFLPPINKIFDKNVDKTSQDVISSNVIGTYAILHEDNSKYEFQNLNEELKIIESMGYKETVRFDSTSLNNNLLSQFFEIRQQSASSNSNSTFSQDNITKLDIFDFGIFRHENTLKHVFFVGKILNDANNVSTFVRMFTLVFE